MINLPLLTFCASWTWVLYFRGRTMTKVITILYGHLNALRVIATNNPVVTGFLIPSLTTATFSILHRVLDVIKAYLLSILCCELQVKSTNGTYVRLDYMFRYRYAPPTCMTAMHKFKTSPLLPGQTCETSDSHDTGVCVFQPVTRQTDTETWNKLVWHKGHPIWIHQTSKAITLRGVYSSMHILKDFVDCTFNDYFQCKHQQKVSGTVDIKTPSAAWDWTTTLMQKIRPSTSLFLQDGVLESLQLDVQTFLQRKEWYVVRGIPYRRGYLLHGPPGTGKSTTVQVLAGALGLAICQLSFNKLTSVAQLDTVIRNQPHKSILLIEDVDALFKEPTVDQPDTRRILNNTSMTFDGLLNVLDGVAAPEGRIIFMTTNFIDRLDPALIRPGRIDVRHEIGLASHHQIAGIVRNFYPDVNNVDVQAFIQHIPSGTVSPADIQGHLFTHINSGLAEAIRHVDDLTAPLVVIEDIP